MRSLALEFIIYIYYSVSIQMFHEYFSQHGRINYRQKRTMITKHFSIAVIFFNQNDKVIATISISNKINDSLAVYHF